ncbi:NAD(P)/FAD-dependent oxidoreductase [Maribacter halichondriae]|uniref:NAD(P)/FAD-dependent oxidoreductase n=1 Tax=Maribacter halichondriae TaxID=2980554 RepID=UPI0030763D8E
MEHYDIIIVGAGLAGLTAALDLTLKKHSVLVIEKDTFPRHKVCGEYVSNEVHDYLDHLGVGLEEVRPISINTLLLSTGKGKSVKTKLPLGGFGISRYTFDNLLYQKAVSLGANFLFQKVASISFQNNGFKVFTNINRAFTSKFVIGAFGKRSNIDKSLDRAFIKRKSHWLGIKSHYVYDDFPDDLVALHTFKGGYGGLSKTESGALNFCYLATYKSFQKYKSVQEFNENVISQNPHLRTFLKDAKPIFEEPLSIAQISFHKKGSRREPYSDVWRFGGIDTSALWEWYGDGYT